MTISIQDKGRRTFLFGDILERELESNKQNSKEIVHLNLEVFPRHLVIGEN